MGLEKKTLEIARNRNPSIPLKMSSLLPLVSIEATERSGQEGRVGLVEKRGSLSPHGEGQLLGAIIEYVTRVR
jgi:hypothetical protein